MAPQVCRPERHDDHMTGSRPDLLVAARAEVLLTGLERLDSLQLGLVPGEGVLEEGGGGPGRALGSATAGHAGIMVRRWTPS